MFHYYVRNKRQKSGNDVQHVHKQGCMHGAIIQYQLDIGWFENSKQAVAAARQRYPHIAASIKGCEYCNSEANFPSE